MRRIFARKINNQMYWAIAGQEGVPQVFLPDAMLADAAHRDGINPVAAHRAFCAAKAKPARFQLVEPDGVTIALSRQAIPDLLFWSWVPIMSDRARGLFVEMGCEVDEFWPCDFESNPGEDFFMHLPQRSIDAVDMVRSTFLATIPVSTPIPHHILSLVLIDGAALLPSCFRAPMPGYDQVLGDLFVSEELKVAWERNGLTGAKFRKLMHG